MSKKDKKMSKENKMVTDRLIVAERHMQHDGTFYTKYTPNFFIDNSPFEKAIESLGGYVYNQCVGKVGEVVIFNGFTWLSISGVPSYGDCDMWAKQLEMAIFETIGSTSPIHIHHPQPGLHSWGIEFNRDRPFWDNPADTFVKSAQQHLTTGWFYQSGSDHPEAGYQFFEFMGGPALAPYEKEEFVARGQAIKIAREIGSIVML